MRDVVRAPICSTPRTRLRRVPGAGVCAGVVLLLLAPPMLLPPTPQGWVLSGGGVEARVTGAFQPPSVRGPMSCLRFDGDLASLDRGLTPALARLADEPPPPPPAPAPAETAPPESAPQPPVVAPPIAPPPAGAQPGDPDTPGAGPDAQVDPLLIGRWPITEESVIDGDTLRIPGQRSVRVRAVDCEEVFHSDKDRAAAAEDFAAYAQAKRGKHPRPRKYGTPLGEAATQYLRRLAARATHVRLERDRLGGHELDTYDRGLGHIIFELPGREVLISEALIRLGYSPYFVKYGRSLRFDAQLRKAELEARAAERGLWGSSPPKHFYPDYPERLRWWHMRADQIDRWRKQAEQPDHITLGTVRAEQRLVARVGKPTTLFGLLSRVVDTKDGTKRIAFLGHRKRQSFPLVFFDKTIFDSLDRNALDSRFITVRGVITLYRGKPQMVVERAEQISTE